MTRDERQALCEANWLKAKGKGTIVGATGFGKTRVGTNILGNLLAKKPDLTVLVVVPTTTLKEQWEALLLKLGYSLNCKVEVINTVIKHQWTVDFLIIDEIHVISANTYRSVFNVVNYKLVLGLTATFERLDGKHEICNQYCPVCDTVPITECLINGWVSPYKEYLVLVDVEDIDEYKKLNKEFIEHFEFFGFNYPIVQGLVGKYGVANKAKLRDKMCPDGTTEERKKVFNAITYHSQRFMQIMRMRKTFINNHVKKVELTRKIIEARPNSKIITFSNSIKVAETIGMGGKVYSGKDTKKVSKNTLDEFIKKDTGVLHTLRKCDAGLDCPGLSVGIIIGTDSSGIKAAQRLGRVVRKEDDKQAEVFYIIINDTVEVKWFLNSHQNQPYTTINEEGLYAVLNHQEPKPYTKKLQDITFRY